MKDLITFRVISVKKNTEIEIISALIEIPLLQNHKQYWVLPINVENGTVLTFNAEEFKLAIFETVDLNLLQNYQIPFWKIICKYVMQAHELIPNVYSLGWDLAITSDGVKLIESNFCWATEVHQKNGPLLRKHLF